MKQVVKSQPARKKLWWLAVLGPLIYVIVDGWIYPIDEGALLERTTYEEVGEPHPPPPSESTHEDVDDHLEDRHTHTGWDIFDMVFLRVKRAWPLLLSFLALKYGRRFVGDPR